MQSFYDPLCYSLFYYSGTFTVCQKSKRRKRVGNAKLLMQFGHKNVLSNVTLLSISLQ